MKTEEGGGRKERRGKGKKRERKGKRREKGGGKGEGGGRGEEREGSGRGKGIIVVLSPTDKTRDCPILVDLERRAVAYRTQSHPTVVCYTGTGDFKALSGVGWGGGGRGNRKEEGGGPEGGGAQNSGALSCFLAPAQTSNGPSKRRIGDLPILRVT